MTLKETLKRQAAAAKVIVADGPDHMVACGIVGDPGLRQELEDFQYRTVRGTHQSGTYLLIWLKEAS